MGITLFSPIWEFPHPSLDRGTPCEGTWDQWNYYGLEMGYPLTEKDIGLVEVLWDLDGLPFPPGMD